MPCCEIGEFLWMAHLKNICNSLENMELILREGSCINHVEMVQQNGSQSTFLIDVAFERLSDARIIELDFVNYFNRLGYNKNGLVSKSIHSYKCL